MSNENLEETSYQMRQNFRDILEFVNLAVIQNNTRVVEEKDFEIKISKEELPKAFVYKYFVDAGIIFEYKTEDEYFGEVIIWNSKNEEDQNTTEKLYDSYYDEFLKNEDFAELIAVIRNKYKNLAITTLKEKLSELESRS